MPDELPECLARCGYERYRQVTGMGDGDRVRIFLACLLDGADEEALVARYAAAT